MKKHINIIMNLFIFVFIEITFYILLKYYCIEDYRQFDETNSWSIEGIIDKVEEPFWGIHRRNSKVKLHINGEIYVFSCDVIGPGGGEKLKYFVGEKANIVVRESKRMVKSQMIIGELKINDAVIQSLEEKNDFNKNQTKAGIVSLLVVWLLFHILLIFIIIVYLFCFKKNILSIKRRR